MVLLVHHGEAEPPGVDVRQPLSARGRAQAELVAGAVAARGLKPDVVWHSGKLRAKQTAESLWHAANPFAAMAAVRGLLPGDPPAWMADALAGETRTIAVVGHQPHLGRLLALLLRGTDAQLDPFPAHGAVALTPAGDGYVEAWTVTTTAEAGA